jgi:hypothetical protein
MASSESEGLDNTMELIEQQDHDFRVTIEHTNRPNSDAAT